LNIASDIEDPFTITLLKLDDETSKYITDHIIGIQSFEQTTSTYDWYPYLTFATHDSIIDQNANYKIQIQSNLLESLNATSDPPFKINPECLSVTPDGLYYTVLSTININWRTVSTPLPTNQPNYSLTIDNFNIQLINTNLDVYVVSSTNTPYKWKVANTSQSLLGTYTLLVQSNYYSIYGSYNITFIQPTQAEYGLLENKKLDANYTEFLHTLLSNGGYTTSIFGKQDWTVGGHTETCELASLTFYVQWP
jgi:hypothetical protein